LYWQKKRKKEEDASTFYSMPEKSKNGIDLGP
jgi:hypothetical protein